MIEGTALGRVEAGVGSLPSVDEIKVDVRQSSKNRTFCRTICVVIGSTLLIVGAFAVGLSVGLAEKGGASSSTSARSSDPVVRQASLEDSLAFLEAQGVGSLSNEESPQYQTALWMALEDPLDLAVPTTTTGEPGSSPDDEDYLQRYVLALLYFATGGPQWTWQHGFLTGVPACEWTTEALTSNLAQSVGVVCNKDGQVVEIDLGT